MNTFGPRLRALRKARGMTLAVLAEAAGITKGYLSKIEHSPAPPTFSTLQAIAIALQADLGDLIEVNGSESASHNIEIDQSGRNNWQQSKEPGGYSFLPLVPAHRNKYLSPFLMRVETGVTSWFEHDGEEFLYQMEGEVELEYEGARHPLKKGTSVYLDSRIRHRFHNHAKKTAVVLAVNFNYRRF